MFNEYTAGAEDDLKRATQIARRMVSHWGMSERLGPVAFRAGDEHPFLGKEMAEPREFSEHTAQVIDEEIGRILRRRCRSRRAIAARASRQAGPVAQALEREETLDEPQIEALIGPPSHRLNGAAGIKAKDEK